MAKYACKWIAYSDASRTTEVGRMDGLIGVADTWDGVITDVEYIDVTKDYTFFTRRVSNTYEASCIGKRYIQADFNPQEMQYENFDQFMPMCWYGTWNFSARYWEVVLSSGVRVVIDAGSDVPTTGGWSSDTSLSVIHPQKGVTYTYTAGIGDKRELFILPFGAPPIIRGGSPNMWGISAIYRMSTGEYGYGLIQWGTDSYGNNHEFAQIFIANESQNEFFRAVFEDAEPTDPYYEYTTQPGGSDADPPEPETDPDFPPEPTFSATDSGMITLFNPDLNELKQLASYMWSSNFDISQLFKIFGDPIDAILGLSITPVTVTHGSAAQFFVGNIATGVTMYKCAKQFESLDCGSLNVTKKYGSYLDYAPYTTAEIYLPFIGTLPIDINDIMGKTVRLLYRFDLISGACCAMIACGGKVLYTFVGQCSASIPITGHDWTNAVNGVLSIAASVASIAVTQGATAPTGIPAIASATINAAKQNIQKSGSLGGAGGMLGPLMPCLIITRPHAAWPKNLKAYEGYPSFISERLGDIHGYTEVYKVHLEGIPATDVELMEIENILKGGVIL